MKTQELPPQDNRSKPSRKWIYRGMALIVVVLICGSLLRAGEVRVLREKANEVRARDDAECFSKALDFYALEYGYHPEGSPSDLLRTLRGDNKRKIIFFVCTTRSMNASGEFIDPWGQPYHIDQSDPSSPRVYSSGPNRLDEHGAKGSDDIVANPKAAL